MLIEPILLYTFISYEFHLDKQIFASVILLLEIVLYVYFLKLLYINYDINSKLFLFHLFYLDFITFIYVTFSNATNFLFFFFFLTRQFNNTGNVIWKKWLAIRDCREVFTLRMCYCLRRMNILDYKFLLRECSKYKMLLVPQGAEPRHTYVYSIQLWNINLE